MAMLPKHIELILEFEPIVKLWCEETNCQNNLMKNSGLFACNLKQLTIGRNGKCLEYKPIEISRKDEN